MVEDGGVVEGGVERVFPDGSDGRAAIRNDFCFKFAFFLIKISVRKVLQTMIGSLALWPQGYKTFFMLNSAEY